MTAMPQQCACSALTRTPEKAPPARRPCPTHASLPRGRRCLLPTHRGYGAGACCCCCCWHCSANSLTRRFRRRDAATHPALADPTPPPPPPPPSASGTAACARAPGQLCSAACAIPAGGRCAVMIGAERERACAYSQPGLQTQTKGAGADSVCSDALRRWVHWVHCQGLCNHLVQCACAVRRTCPAASAGWLCVCA